jgi:hypothetical protein
MTMRITPKHERIRLVPHVHRADARTHRVRVLGATCVTGERIVPAAYAVTRANGDGQ